MTLGELVRLAEESEGGEEWGEYTIVIENYYESMDQYHIQEVIFDAVERGSVVVRVY